MLSAKIKTGKNKFGTFNNITSEDGERIVGCNISEHRLHQTRRSITLVVSKGPSRYCRYISVICKISAADGFTNYCSWPPNPPAIYK
jgi:hypothetical protein